ncbi:MAG TPA: hypothetical protein VIZ66_03735 [Sphingomicrobium sp.]
MFGKAFLGIGAAVAIGAYFNGAFSGSYARTVGASPDEVRSALEDLDIREAPGEPATDPMRSGGVAPTFLLTQQGDDLVWTVMSRDDVAVRLIAHLEPVDGGKRTKVTASVERGNAPDDFVAPAFRDRGVTLGLFGMVLDSELDELVAPPLADEATCQKIMDDFAAGNAADPDLQSRDSMSDAFGDTAKIGMKLGALESKLKAAGCPVNNGGAFRPVSNQMSESSSSGSNSNGDVRFEPGKPMIDVSK